MQTEVVGRKREVEILQGIFNSKDPEFLAIYGRRRVGKTHLIREFFSDKGVYFEITGQKEGNMHVQLENFIRSFSMTFFNNIPLKIPSNWQEAFSLIDAQISAASKKFIFFIDELPWLATPKSNVMQTLDHFWNAYWSRRSNIILIVCGSAASWMLDELINAKGGLYNRLTKTILLKPFNLKGTQEFLESRGIHLKPIQILDLYMVFGGIPHYLKQIAKGKSAQQIINDVCFKSDGLLYGEFDRLFHSLFNHAEVHFSIVKAIASQRNGISREKLIEKTGIPTGGSLNKYLQELEASEIIKSYTPLDKKKKDRYFRISDEYVLFYLQWIEPIKDRGMDLGDAYWKTQLKTAKMNAWKGYSFESICLKHSEQIKRALGLENIHSNIGGWRYLPKKGSKNAGTQIDLIFDREDGAVTLCEIKYSDYVFKVDKEYAKDLASKITIFEENYSTKKQVFMTLITTCGIKHSLWSEDLIHSDLTLKDLF